MDLFYKNLLLLLRSTVVAQIIPMVLMPVLSRVCPVEEHGIFSIYFSIIAPLTVLATLRYELAIVLPPENSKALGLVGLGLIVAFFLAFLLFCFIHFYYEEILLMLNYDKIGKWMYFIPLSLFLNGIIQIFNSVSNRESNYKILGNSKLYFSIFSNVLPFLFLTTNGGIIIGYILSQILIVIYLLWISKQLIRDLFLATTLSNVKKTALEYKNFPLLNAPSSIMDQVASSLPFFFITKMFSVDAVANFGMTAKIISIPSAFLSYSVSQVLFQELCNRKNLGKENFSLLKDSFKKLLLFGFLPYTFLLFFGQELFGFFLGQQWQLAGTMAQVLAFSAYVKFVVSTLSISLIVHNKLYLLAFWQALKLITNVLLITTINYHSINQYLLLLLLSDVFLYILYLILIFGSTKY